MWEKFLLFSISWEYTKTLVHANFRIFHFRMINSVYNTVVLCVLLQAKYQVDPAYLSQQSQINSKMRAILIDWLIQVHLRFTLLQETLYLTVSIIDRYLQVRHSPDILVYNVVLRFICFCLSPGIL